jgi:hypothetical protein
MTKVTKQEGEGQESKQEVYLPQVISNEFGTSLSIAREQIVLGMITIDGEEWKGDRFYLPYDDILDKEISVQGRDRTFKFEFKGDQADFERR